RRVAHQVYDLQPHVLQDPIAVPILGAEYAEQLKKTATKLNKPFSAALRAFVVARSRYAEDTLARAVAAGARQYVLLGAGLDTFAYRNPHAGLRVFEVDHPATQAWKRERIAASGLTLPASATFVPVDFERQSLKDAIAASSFDRARPAFFSWLGVVPYLTVEAITATLRFVGAGAIGTGIALDYGQPAESVPFTERIALSVLARRVAAAGEPFRSSFTPDAIERTVRDAGFTTIEDIGMDVVNDRYFRGRSDGLSVAGKTGRLLSAWRQS
ncbi:MAG TPA: class I SAM-dependent methyltransferase, partial [Vicinamibacterales bacterium]|nr:class I SAM-dependent methyltransferase [Vicinamibacterales bacterium]